MTKAFGKAYLELQKGRKGTIIQRKLNIEKRKKLKKKAEIKKRKTNKVKKVKKVKKEVPCSCFNKK
jgi:hypothetical protein